MWAFKARLVICAWDSIKVSQKFQHDSLMILDLILTNCTICLLYCAVVHESCQSASPAPVPGADLPGTQTLPDLCQMSVSTLWNQFSAGSLLSASVSPAFQRLPAPCYIRPGTRIRRHSPFSNAQSKKSS